ncbi:PE domain-containing protein [Mycobacterium riyadhense]|uniref:PE domain-containing protein n=1 Tax=Mycobacterium riyadhense TaxID=486698 RepID=UPI003B968F81
MSFLIAAPELLAAAAVDLASINRALTAANAAAAAPDRRIARRCRGRGLDRCRGTIRVERPGVSSIQRASDGVS